MFNLVISGRLEDGRREEDGKGEDEGRRTGDVLVEVGVEGLGLAILLGGE